MLPDVSLTFALPTFEIVKSPDVSTYNERHGSQRNRK
jgi:hypothetical protein